MSVGSDKLRLLRQIPTVKFEEEMRGYSKSQVDRVLETLAPLADEIETLQQQLHDANQRADEAAHRASAIAGQSMGADHAVTAQAPDGDFDQTLRNTLLLAQRTADQTIRDAEQKAEELRRSSTAQADSIMAGARAEAKELKGEAHAQREQMLADAESERAQLLADALEHADARRAAIEEELLSEQGIRRNELLAEISQLERSRDDLSADVHRFEQFLEGRRENVRSALVELNSVLDDPELLAETETPEPAEIGLLDPEELTTLSIDSHSIGTLSSEVDAARQQAADFAFTEPDPDPEVEVAESVTDPAGSESESTEFESTEFDDGDFDRTEFEGSDVEVDAPRVGDSGEEPAFIDDTADRSHVQPDPASEEASPAEEFAAAVDNDQPFAAPSADLGAENWQPFAHHGDQDTPAGAPDLSESDQNPFATGGFLDTDSGAGIAASVTPDSVFSSVPETADPSAYSDFSSAPESPMSDPEGLGIDVESPFAEQPEEEADSSQGLGGLAEQARSRLASRVSRLRDTAVPEFGSEADGSSAGAEPPAFESASAVVEAPEYQEPNSPFQEPTSPFQESVPPPPGFGAEPPAAGADTANPFVSESEANLPPPPGVSEYAADSSPAFPSNPVEGSEWSVPDPDRPIHPDARIEDLPPDDPFLDELRQMTGGEQPGSDDETLNRFLADDGEKESGGGWFGRRNR